jgi:DNA/RNA-binding domain of Phe-tRNA-synthetase-like protein
MSTRTELAYLLDQASIEDAVWSVRPDYRVMLVLVTGVRGGPSDEGSDAMLTMAENTARRRLAGTPPEALPEIAAWRGAFLGFGVKPRVARSSVEALLRRIDNGLPRVNRLTDIYNAVSVQHLLPVGGENIDQYSGPPRLARAGGDEPFDTVADGSPITLNPAPGEVVWRDDLGITCRRWNWRQCVRTRLDESTENVLFILDALAPTSPEALHAATEALVTAVTSDTPGAEAVSRLVGQT